MTSFLKLVTPCISVTPSLLSIYDIEATCQAREVDYLLEHSACLLAAVDVTLVQRLSIGMVMSGL